MQSGLLHHQPQTWSRALTHRFALRQGRRKSCTCRRPLAASQQVVLASATKEKVQEVQESSNQGRKVAADGAELLSWDDIGELAGTDVLKGYQLLDQSANVGQPRTAPTRVLPAEESTTTDRPVLLYRDTNAWCPFCERVWLALEEKNIPYDTVLINLQDKPDWYKKLVPTELVPAVKINGKLVYESYDIMMELERQFPDPPLLPGNEELQEEVEDVCKLASAIDDQMRTPCGGVQHSINASGNAANMRKHKVSSAGYKYLASRMKEQEDPDNAQGSQDAFLLQLDAMENQLGKHSGPYLTGDFSLADIVHCSAMERFAANMPVVANLHVRGHSRYPNITRWYSAMDARPAYQKVKSDETTLNLVIRKVFGITMTSSQPVTSFAQLGRNEAAAKLSKNKEVVRADIVRRSGVLRGHDSSSGGSNGADQATSVPKGVQEAVDHAMRRLASYLLTGKPGPRHEEAEARAIGAAGLAYFRNRASAPRDLSANACGELRDACLAVLQDSY